MLLWNISYINKGQKIFQQKVTSVVQQKSCSYLRSNFLSCKRTIDTSSHTETDVCTKSFQPIETKLCLHKSEFFSTHGDFSVSTQYL